MKLATVFLFTASCLATAMAWPQNVIRVFVTGSQSWETNRGASPQTAEIIKTLNQKCPEVTVTSERERSDFVIMLDHEGGKNIIKRDNKIVLFDHSGDVIYSHSVRMVGSAVSDVCQAIYQYAPGHEAGKGDGKADLS